MNHASKHPDEIRRLKALRALNILDSAPEKDYDDIVLIASQICGTPASVISLIDEDQIWFKAKIGIGKDHHPCDRDISFCSHTILENDSFIVNNALNDRRFCDHPMVTGDLKIRFYAGVPLQSPDGYPVGSLCVFDSVEREISTLQLEALKALSRQVTKLLSVRVQNESLKSLQELAGFRKTIIENLSEGIMLLDKNRTVIKCNPAATELLGLASDETLIGRSISQYKWNTVTEEGAKFPDEEMPLRKCLHSGERQTHVVVGIYRKPDDLRWLSFNAIPLFLDGPKDSTEPSHAILSFTDITDVKAMASNRRYLEAKLSESGRRSALGVMAGGIAHEINNPLGIIVGKTYLLKSKLMAGTLDINAVKDFEKIESTVERIAKIIKSLKTYSRNAEDDPLVYANISEIISDSLVLCTDRFKNHGIELKVSCDTSYEVECRPAQISQLLVNVLNNSFDAIQNLPHRWIDIAVHIDDSNYKISVTDSGNGIPSTIAGKIMLPFYSTKEFGKSMGLGLSTALGIAESHNGQLEYDGQSKNTRFVLTLPSLQPIKKSA
jgi:PAS domain S-box-containing protein